MQMQLIVLAGVGAVGVVATVRWFAADIYDVVIVHMTSRWYACVLQQLKSGDRVLDVGIGTATALAKNKALMLEKRVAVVGIDYEAAYVQKAEAVLRAADLWRKVPEGTSGYRPGDHYCRVYHASVYDAGLGRLCSVDEPAAGSLSEAPKAEIEEAARFDAAYFSGSLTLMPDPAGALRAMVPLIKSAGGRILITQTFQKSYSPAMAFLKPLLKYVTTIDFGRLTTEEDIKRIISDAGVFDTVSSEPIAGSINNPFQVARLIELRVKKS